MALGAAWCVRWRWVLRAVLGAVAVCAVAGALMQHALHPVVSAEDIRQRIAVREAVLCEGVVAARPERMIERSRVVVRVERCRDGAVMTPTAGRVLLYAAALPDTVEHGMRVRFRSTLHPPTRFLNPGTETFGLKWEADGVVAVGSLSEPQWITVVGDAAGPLTRGLRAWRVAASLAVADLPASPEVIGVLRAMILGQGDALEQLWWERFRRVGVVHLLVVSGLHIAAVAWVLYAGVGWLCRRSSWLITRVAVWRVAALSAIAGSWGYTWLTGANLPAQRSAWFITVLFAGQLLDRRHDLWSALALSVLVLLVASPLVLWLPSFQLTFAAVTAIVVYVEIHARRGGARTWRTRIVNACGVTLAATVGVTPIIAYHFHETSLMGVLTNLLLVPFVSVVITPLGLLFIGVAPWWPAAAALMGTPLVWLTTAFTAFTNVVDQWSGPWQLHWVPLGSEVVLWYLGCGVIVLWWLGLVRWQRSAWTRWVLVGSLSSVMLLVAWQRCSPWFFANRLQVVFLDVGQGSAAVVRFPNGRVYMIDGGGIPRSQFDIGRWIVAPALRRLQIDHVDRLVMTHYHPDHYPGLAFVAETFGAQRLDVNGSRAAADDVQWTEFAARIAQTPITQQVLNVATAPWTEGTVQLRVLHPDAAKSFDGLKENDRSIVLELTHQNVRLLLTGDIESAAEQQLLAAGTLRPADLVVAPHHGSDTSSTPPWVQAVHPRYAVISCGRHNRYNFPRESVLRTYAQHETQVFRTDQHGAITVTSDGKKLKIETFVDD